MQYPPHPSHQLVKDGQPIREFTIDQIETFALEAIEQNPSLLQLEPEPEVKHEEEEQDKVPFHFDHKLNTEE